MEREGCNVCKCLKIPGVCFDPSDEELVAYYLTEKIQGRPLQCNHLMTELKIYDDDLMPWEVLKDDNPYWMTSSSDSSNKIKKTIYVFTELRKKKSRVIRRSGRGSWTGQNNPVVKDKAGNDIGYNKLLTFYEDTDDKKGKKGKKKINNHHQDHSHGHWIMHEYSLFGMDKYVLCKIIKEVRINAKASVLLCPTKAAETQDFCTQGDAEIMNVALDDERQLGGGDQTLDESTTDWDKNGWMEELYEQLGENIPDVQELAIDGQDDIQIPNFLVEEEAIVVANQPSDDSGADLDENGWNSVLYGDYGSADDHKRTGISDDYTNAGVGVVQELGSPQQGNAILDVLLLETVAVVQELPVTVCRKNRQTDGAYTGFDGAAGIHDIIILDDSCSGVHDVQDFMTIEEVDAPRIKAINEDEQADCNMEGNKQILDDFWNFELDHDVSQTNKAWDGLDVILDFSSPELFDLWPGDETKERSCSIVGSQPEKRMRYGEEDKEECLTGKKQRCI